MENYKMSRRSGGEEEETRPESDEKLRIALVSDFFIPQLGGVEMHMYNVAQCLMKKGHKVIVITSVYQERIGVRYLSNGLKVYHLPLNVMASQTTYPELLMSHMIPLR